MMTHSSRYAIGLATALTLASPAAAQTPPPATEHSAARSDQQLDAFTNAMTKIFAAKPLTAEQEARVPLAREVVGTMTPDGFYGDVMDDMMSSMLTPLSEMIGGPLAADELLEEQVGIAPEDVPDLTDAQREEIVALLDPAAKERAAALTASMTTSLAGMFRKFEAPLRDGLTKAFAVRFSDAELRDIQRFFATPAGASFARQSFAVYADPQVMSASMSVLPDMIDFMPQMFGNVEASVADLPKERGYDDLSAAQRQRLARLLGMNEAELRRSMTEAERERDRAEAQEEE